MRAMADCIFMQGAKIKDDGFLRGEAIIWINWEEIYQLFHQEALDGRLVGSVSILLSLRIVLHDLNILIS